MVEIKDWIESRWAEDIVLIPGFDSCFEGLGFLGAGCFSIYNEEKMLEKLMVDLDCTWDDAVDYFDFNIAGSLDKKVIFIEKFERDPMADVEVGV